MALTKPSTGILDVGGDSFLRNVYDTNTQAAAAFPGTDVLGFISLGYATIGDGGLGLYVYDVSPESAAVITTANGRTYELEVDVADIRQFGAVTNSTVTGVMTQNVAACNAAVAYSKVKGASVYIPAGNFYLNGDINIDHAVNMWGNGDNSKLLLRNITTYLFDINLGAGGQINFSTFRNFAVHLSLSSGSAEAHAFNIRGTGDCYFQWATIENIYSYGWRAFWNVEASSHVTSFGNEGPVNWCQFKNIIFNGGSDFHYFGFIFNTGSGTGNEFYGCRGFIHQWVWLYQGAGGVGRVVGDIVIMGGHFGSYDTVNSRVFTVGSNMQYRSRIRIQGMQADAGMAGILSLSNVGGGYTEVIVDVTRGGGCIMGNWPTMTSSSLGFSRGTIAAA